MIAFNTAQAYIRAGIYKTILVVGAESMSRLVDWSDRSTSVLFGDGAGALILKAEEGDHYWQTGHSDGTKRFCADIKIKKVCLKNRMIIQKMSYQKVMKDRQWKNTMT